MRSHILTLRIKKYWFDKIKSGEKKIEYRDDKPFYRSRLHDGITHLKLIVGYAKDAESGLFELSEIKFIDSQILFHLK